MSKRMVFKMLALSAILPFSISFSSAQSDFPNRTITVVVPWPAGGVTDIGARLLSERLAKNLGTPVIVDNRPGANGFIGTQHVAKSPPDGYTLLLVTTTTHAVAPNLYRKLPYDPIKDFSAVTQTTLAPTIAVGPANSPYKNLSELVAAAKASPGKLNYATYGAAGSSQLAATMFMQAAGIEMTAIPYQGANPAIVGLLAGDTDIFFDSIPASLSHVKAGRLTAFAVTSPERVPAAPEIPTLSETYPGIVYNVWQGVQAPAGTPKVVVDKLHAEISKVLKEESFKERMMTLGAIAVSSNSPSDFEKHIATEKERIGGLIRSAKIPYID